MRSPDNNPNSFRYAVFGAGRQGTAAIYDLVKFCEASKVLAVEPDAKRRKESGSRMQKLLGKDAKRISWTGSAKALDLFGFDVILSCAPYQANLALTKMALQAGVAFCDLGGNPETVAAQEKLASKKKIPVVPDCGVSPGLSNILAVHCAHVHGAETVEVRCGGLPLQIPDPKENPLQYKLVFSPWGLISEYSGRVPAIRNGKLSYLEALGSIESFDSEHESSPTSNNSPQVVQYLARCGVKHYDYMTVRYNGHWKLAQGWKSIGYLKGNSEKDAQLAALLESDPILRYHPDRDRDVLILRVRGSKQIKSLQRSFEYRFDVPSDLKTRFAAMELMTAWGITIVAHHMASGRGKPHGFATPERFVDTAWVISELERRLKSVSAK